MSRFIISPANGPNQCPDFFRILFPGFALHPAGHIHTHWPEHKRKAVQGDAEARQWIRSATVLAENFSVQLP